tara:strand:+ start:801 stop:1103 length:303 start_codon:yes stop_codon:yes gene_type:complete
MNEVQLAKEIVNQIMATDKWALGAYAAEDLKVIGTDENYIGGLQFSCNGYNVKGKTTIKLHWNDTYTIDFYDKEGVNMKSVNDVYCDQLVSVLDYIELKK